MTCADIRDDLQAYALGALDEDEVAAVEAHLGSCADCRRLVEEAAETAHALPLALSEASPLAPPPALWERVLRAATAPEASAAGPTSAGHTSAPLAAPGGARPSARLAWLRRRWSATGVALLLLISAGSVLWGAGLSFALDQERALRERVEAFHLRQQELVLEVVDSSQTTRRILVPPDGTDPGGPYGKLFTRADLPEVVAVLGRMPTPPPGQHYRLWLRERGTSTDAGVISVDDLGFGLLVFKADRAGPTYEAAEVRLEAPGDDAPTGTPILRWEAEG